ncbi:MAG: arsenic resistance N-acetyltransferase ArsN2 [Candidatus Bathyarchaeia archaeon]|jgi:amino-acid N-acetyltransferase
MLADIRIRPAVRGDLQQISHFLNENELPTVGVEKCVENFVVAQSRNGSWVGVAGLEVYGKSGLLRSVAVDQRFRGMGQGRALVDAVLRNARAKGLERIYLLTDTAQAYFSGLGFEVVGRKDIDEAVKASPEFPECGEGAAAMRKLLS